MAKRKHTSARGEVVDFDLLHHQNRDVVAVGNASMNANGDVLGRGGKIIRKVEDVPSVQLANPAAAYNQTNPKSTRMVSLKDKIDSVDTNKKPVLEDVVEEVEVLTKTKSLPQEELVDEVEEKAKSKRKIVDSED